MGITYILGTSKLSCVGYRIVISESSKRLPRRFDDSILPNAVVNRIVNRIPESSLKRLPLMCSRALVGSTTESTPASAFSSAILSVDDDILCRESYSGAAHALPLEFR